MAKPTDDQILAAVHGWQIPTYVVANRLRTANGRPDTAFVLRRLKAMEKTGKVRRVQSPYAVMICWEAV